MMVSRCISLFESVRPQRLPVPEGGPVQGWLPECQRVAKRGGGSGSSVSGSRYVEDRVFERSGLSMIQNPVYR